MFGGPCLPNRPLSEHPRARTNEPAPQQTKKRKPLKRPSHRPQGKKHRPLLSSLCMRCGNSKNWSSTSPSCCGPSIRQRFRNWRRRSKSPSAKFWGCSDPGRCYAGQRSSRQRPVRNSVIRARAMCCPSVEVCWSPHKIERLHRVISPDFRCLRPLYRIHSGRVNCWWIGQPKRCWIWSKTNWSD